MDFLRILICIAYILFWSFILVLVIGLLYNTKTKKAIVRVTSRVLVYLYSIFSLSTVAASDRFMGLNGDEVVHSIICMIIYMAALLYAVAKNDPNAHKKVEMNIKKAK